MIQLPAVYAVHFVRDRWLAIAPDQHAMHGQTFVRQELRAVDLSGTAPARVDRYAPPPEAAATIHSARGRMTASSGMKV
jgi:hypothetical protein